MGVCGFMRRNVTALVLAGMLLSGCPRSGGMTNSGREGATVAPLIASSPSRAARCKGTDGKFRFGDFRDVIVTPRRAAVGDRVEFRGGCLPKIYARGEPNDISITGFMGSDGRSTRRSAQGCPFRAGAEGRYQLTRWGSMRGHFIVPAIGVCSFETKERPVGPGAYRLVVGCQSCGVANFRVTKD